MKKKVVIALVVLMACAVLLACGPTYKTINANGYSYEIEASWVEEKSEYGFYIYRPKENSSEAGVVVFQYEYARALSDPRQQMEKLRDEVEDDEDYKYSNIKEGTFGSYAMITADYALYRDGEVQDRGEKVAFYASPTLYVSISGRASEENYSKYKKTLEHMVSSAKALK